MPSYSDTHPIGLKYVSYDKRSGEVIGYEALSPNGARRELWRRKVDYLTYKSIVRVVRRLYRIGQHSDARAMNRASIELYRRFAPHEDHESRRNHRLRDDFGFYDEGESSPIGPPMRRNSPTNYFDSAAPAVRTNMMRDVIQMVSRECGRQIGEYHAAWIARKLLAGKRTSDALYNVSTTRLHRLVDTLDELR